MTGYATLDDPDKPIIMEDLSVIRSTMQGVSPGNLLSSGRVDLMDYSPRTGLFICRKEVLRAQF
jgi:hypothetical protein